MEIHNYMEDLVKTELQQLLVEIDDICKCQKCICDMMVWALNRIPPRYVITSRGRMFTKLREQEIQFKADIIRELTKAIIYVSKNPQH